MIRFGLCCLFVNEPVKFRTTTAASLKALPVRKRLEKLSSICLANAVNVKASLLVLERLKIKSFRMSSGLFPVFTHPDVGYAINELPDAVRIRDVLRDAGRFASKNDIRLSFHPDQFVVLSSPREEVVANSARELCYHGVLAELTGAELINIHLGGRYGCKKDAIERFRNNFGKLPESVRKKLSLENDDVSYTPSDLHGLCLELSLPMVYDVHHHRCNPDGLSIKEATELCLGTWKRLDREPYFHISSPKEGWSGRNKKSHADYIDPEDFPGYWRKLKGNFTLDVEAKAKELAVEKLMAHLGKG
ncbi:MAG TPA: UV DNA damage repair endonuclease UvsE [Lentisphaeria bacterium]|nr:MAG: UV damage repair endonuclease UvsE [Lentisphaerae bacterium GWF2_50_93]HCE42975.1 UV DNA damage repair endonuclease UvsE [Lentisphaeria bacterium]